MNNSEDLIIRKACSSLEMFHWFGCTIGLFTLPLLANIQENKQVNREEKGPLLIKQD